MKKLDIWMQESYMFIPESTHQIIDFIQYKIISTLDFLDNEDLKGIFQIIKQIDSYLNDNKQCKTFDLDSHSKFIEYRKYIIWVFMRRIEFDWLWNYNIQLLNTKIQELFIRIENDFTNIN